MALLEHLRKQYSHRRGFGCAVLLLLGLVLTSTSHAEDWPQWRGPRRNGHSTERDWLAAWPADRAPKIAWTASVGKGHSAVSVSNGRACTMGWDGRKDTVHCFDAATGKLLWRQSYPCEGIKQWPGPRATPTMDGDTVYTLSQHGLLHAFDAGSGKKKWAVQLPASYNPDVDYGFAWSPLIEEDLLILGCGSKGLALHRKDGTFVWGNDGQHGACASPVPFEWRGERGVALITCNPGRDSVTLVGVRARTGEELWLSPPWEEKWGAACVDLLVHDHKVFVTTSEQHQRCARFTIKDGKLRQDWSSPKLACYTGGCVLVGGHVYGVTKAGLLKCLDWDTGAERWAERGFGGHGALMAAGDRLIVQCSHSGEVVVVEPASDGYRELRRVKVFADNPETFTVPVLANGLLYCRSYEGQIVCLDLRSRDR